MDSWSVAPVKNVADLGVTIDSKLKFSTHINGIAAKAQTGELDYSMFYVA